MMWYKDISKEVESLKGEVSKPNSFWNSLKEGDRYINYPLRVEEEKVYFSGCKDE